MRFCLEGDFMVILYLVVTNAQCAVRITTAVAKKAAPRYSTRLIKVCVLTSRW